MLVCANCECEFSETKNTFLHNVKTPIRKIWDVINSRTEGLGLNATARVFRVAKKHFGFLPTDRCGVMPGAIALILTVSAVIFMNSS